MSVRRVMILSSDPQGLNWLPTREANIFEARVFAVYMREFKRWYYKIISRQPPQVALVLYR